MSFPRLDRAQVRLLTSWFAGARVVVDHSWGLTDTVVLQLRVPPDPPNVEPHHVVVKAGGPTNHHLSREITAHERWMGVWTAVGRAPRLLRADRRARLLVTSYLPGVLVQGHPAEEDPATYRQAGELLALLHGQSAMTDPDHEAALDARALAWLDHPHRIPEGTVRRLRARIAAHPQCPATVVPTHGDWQPRNWVVQDGQVSAIDFGRAALRTPASDFARLSTQQFSGRPDLEAAFLEGYGTDPREPEAWARVRLREAIGTAVWAHQVGDTAFEEQGHRMIRAALDDG